MQIRFTKRNNENAVFWKKFLIQILQTDLIFPGNMLIGVKKNFKKIIEEQDNL